ncbi:cellulase family glycosylhydrolase [Acetobacter estunensis]|uniref:Cellulase family glycosylhydrolase n=1 Tax=Acetobacter estunensis TaxID=104097 RepID=A0A967BAY4_9PROT|nr:cellulase family glycosylhydrolase [Acetobacter estunensis]NHO53703.1 cellulase family glycosylhydrolase [Acetobacter estunensis]
MHSAILFGGRKVVSEDADLDAIVFHFFPIKTFRIAARLSTAGVIFSWHYHFRRTTILIGVNLGGLEDGSTFSTRAYYNYNVPNASRAEGWIALGCTAARIPHNLYRMQPGGMGTDLDPTYFGYSTALAQPYLDAKGFVFFDPHGFGSIQTSGATVDITTTEGEAQYLDYMTRLATKVTAWMGDASSSCVGIGLMNEPSQHDNATYQLLWNKAIAAMRGAGYKGTILVPWTDWQAVSQFSATNPPPAVVDDVGPCVLDVHCYLDQYNTGSGASAASATIGVERFAGLFASQLPLCYSGIVLSETGCPNDDISRTAFSNMLTALAADSRMIATTVWCDDAWLAKNANYITADTTDPRVQIMLDCLPK